MLVNKKGELNFIHSMWHLSQKRLCNIQKILQSAVKILKGKWILRPLMNIARFFRRLNFFSSENLWQIFEYVGEALWREFKGHVMFSHKQFIFHMNLSRNCCCCCYSKLILKIFEEFFINNVGDYFLRMEMEDFGF